VNFWDRFILSVYFGFGDHLPVGRDVAARLFAEGFHRGRLALPGLNDLSILLLLTILPTASAWRPPVEQEAVRRRLHQQPRRVWQLLQASTPPRLTELLEIARPQGPHLVHLRDLVVTILTDLDLASAEANLSMFLGRVWLNDPAVQQPAARVHILRAIRRCMAVDLGTIDYPTQLYLRVLNRVMQPGQPLPETVPDPMPGWVTALEPAEQELLRRCLDRLIAARRNGPAEAATQVEADLVLLYVQIYGQLTVPQIASVLQYAEATITADQVALSLEEAWNAVL
jgi:hypothetical protein